MIAERIVREEEPKMVKEIKNYIYDPQEVVGSGFSSKVFKGVNELTQETIAIKVLELSKIQSEVEKYLLNNEINALRALSHPHILRTV